MNLTTARSSCIFERDGSEEASSYPTNLIWADPEGGGAGSRLPILEQVKITRAIVYCDK